MPKQLSSRGLDHLIQSEYSSIAVLGGGKSLHHPASHRLDPYKPDTPHFTRAIAELAAMGIERRRILHVGQSRRADTSPAIRHGLTFAWINRGGWALGLTGYGAEEAKPEFVVSTLAELVAALTLNGALPRVTDVRFHQQQKE